MKSYNDYLETLKKMVQFRNLFQELNGKKISEITEDVIQHIQNSCVCDYYDKHDQIGDFYFVDADEVFELFEALNVAEEVIFYDFSPDHLKMAFCLSFHYYKDEVIPVYINDIDRIIQLYIETLAVFKAWENEDNQADDTGRRYTVLVIQESNKNYYIDSKTGDRIYCWERQEVISTNYFKKLLNRIEEINEKAWNDYYPEKILINLDTGEEITSIFDDTMVTEPTDRATYFLQELGYFPLKDDEDE